MCGVSFITSSMLKIIRVNPKKVIVLSVSFIFRFFCPKRLRFYNLHQTIPKFSSYMCYHMVWTLPNGESVCCKIKWIFAHNTTLLANAAYKALIHGQQQLFRPALDVCGQQHHVGDRTTRPLKAERSNCKSM